MCVHFPAVDQAIVAHGFRVILECMLVECEIRFLNVFSMRGQLVITC